MRYLRTFLIFFGLFVQACLTEIVENTKREYNTNNDYKKVSKRDYYAPEYNHEQYSYPAYRFEYGVHDPHTGDIKKQYEERDGDTVRGYYSLVEPDGSIRLVEYTADSKNGFQAVVKKFGHSHHPDTVTHHLNTANGHNHDAGVGYAPNYHGGSADDYNHNTSPPSHHNNHYNPHNSYEPPHVYNVDHHYQPHHYQPAPPPTYNHYDYKPQAPSVYNPYYYEPSSPSVYSHNEQPHASPPSTYYNYDQSAHYKPHPETVDFPQNRPLPLFAAGIPTAQEEYGSASPEEYYPAPLHFPAAASHENKYDDGDNDHQLQDYKFPAVDDGEPQIGSAERPEYLRKYFEPNYRSRVSNDFYDDDESK